MGRHLFITLFLLCIVCLIADPAVAEEAAEELEDDSPPIPMPGEEMAIPLPGDELVPLPGDEAVPLPGDEAAVPEPALVPGQFAGNSPFPWDLRGYVEDTFNGEYVKQGSHESLLNVLRARLNLSGRPDPHFDFGLGLIGTLYTGATDIPMARYFPDSLQKTLIPPSTIAVSEGMVLALPGVADFYHYQLSNNIYIQEAFGTLYVPYFRLRVGRHKFYTGTGYAYNPIDLFNYKNPLDPTYEVDGMDAIFFSIELPAQVEIQGLARVSDRFKEMDYLARLTASIGPVDLGFQYTHHIRKRMDWQAMNQPAAIAAFVSGAEIGEFERRFRWHLVAAEFAAEIWEIGIHAEGGYAFIRSVGDPGTLAHAAENHERFLVGLDHTFDFELYILVEYLHVGQGRDGTSEITLNDRMGFFAGEQIAIDKDTVFIGLSYPLSDLIELSLYTIVACNDPSAIINPWLIFDLYPGLKLSLTANVALGSEEGSNGKAGTGGFARLRFNF